MSRGADRSRRAAAGLFAGALSSLLLQPLDVIGTRMQMAAATRGHASMLRTVREVWADGGARALWAGTFPSTLRLAGGIGLYFLFLGEAEHAARRAFGELSGMLQTLLDLALGGGSRAFAVVLFCPITILKTRAEQHGSQRGGLLEELARIARVEGRGGLFAGLGASLARDVPYSAVALALFRWLQTQFRLVAGGWLPATAIATLAGAASGTFATMATQPADVVRTQLVLGARDKDNTLGMRAILLGLLRSRGPGALFVGWSARAVRRMLMQALTWSIFQAVVGG